MKRKNIGVNAILNVIKTSLSIIFPLITYPYALQVLGVANIGAVSYVQSIVNYFSLFAMLGVSTYAIREGAKIRDNKESFSIFSREVFTINVIFTAIAYVLLILTVFLIEGLRQYQLLFFIQSFSIIFTTLAVDWINTVHEDYIYTTVRGIVINILSLVLLFILIKVPEDYYKYTLIHIITQGLVCLTNWYYCRKYVKLSIVRKPNFKKHLPRLLILFVNALAVSIYVNFDMTMLGWMKDDIATGLYSAPTKVYTVVKSLMIAVYSVTIPRLASYIGQKNGAAFKLLYSKLWSGISLLLIPACVGMMCLSGNIIGFFGGEQYQASAVTLRILSGALLFSIFGGLVTTCLNITIGRERENLLVTLLSAGINCLLNIFFIPALSYNGAAITTMIAEAFVVLFCIARLPNKRNYFDWDYIRKNIGQALIGSAVIAVSCFVINRSIESGMISLVVSIIISIVIYGGLLLLMRNRIAIEYCELIKKRFFKK